MGERRFLIMNFGENDVPIDGVITESELRYRIGKIRKLQSIDVYGDCDYELAIDIFLHGEGEKGEESQFAPKDISPYTRVFGIDNQPTPTRQEWEEWAENELTLHCPYATGIYKANRKAWLLSMPIVPKG